MQTLKLILALAEALALLLLLLAVAGSLINRRAERLGRARLLAGGDGDDAADGVTYRSKIGAAYVGGLLLLCAFAFWVGYVGLHAFSAPAADELARTDAGVVILGLFRFCFWSMLACGAAGPLGLALFSFQRAAYVVTADELVVAVGDAGRMMRELHVRPPFAALLETRIRLADVLEVRRSWDVMGTPTALALPRLKVRYRVPDGGEDYILICPEDERGFVADLCARVPGLWPAGPLHAARHRVTPEVEFRVPESLRGHVFETAPPALRERPFEDAGGVEAT